MSQRRKLLLKITRDGPASELESVLDSPNGLCDEETGTSWLHRAARHGRPAEVQELIRLGAKVDNLNKMKMTPLHCGAISGNSEVVRILISSGADVKLSNEKGITALHWASGNGYESVLMELLESEDGKIMIDALDDEGFTPLHRCCQEKRKKGAQNMDTDDDHKKSLTAKLLLQKGANPSILQKKGQHTALHLCAMNNLSKTAEMILLQDASLVNFRNKIGMTPLLYAVKENHFNMVEVLLKHGADPLMPDPIHFNWNSIHFSIIGNNVQILEVLLKNNPEGKDSVDDVGRSPLILAQEYERSEGLIQLLR